MSDTRTRVAIACQGGGSHTAFSAGALKKLLAAPQYDFVAFSGTSGGAIDALLAWYGSVHDGEGAVGDRLEAFWDDMSARSLPDSLFNTWALATYRALSPVVAPEISPYLYPELASRRLREAIERHVDFDKIPQLAAKRGASLPMLVVGAVEVRSGNFQLFKNVWDPKDKLQLQVTAEAILASAAIPTLFRAVPVEQGGQVGLYWDGLFSQNPPVRDLPEADPDQIWVLQINPSERQAEPRQMGDIRDRRNELAGNLSLRQELHFIEKINKMVRGHGTSPFVCDEVDNEGVRKTRSYREIKVFCIELDEHELGVHLDTESKLNREPRFIRQLFECGERQAKTFLDGLAGDNAGAAYAYR